MKRMALFLVGTCVLVLSTTGCCRQLGSCKSSMKVKETYSTPVVKKEVKIAPVKKVVAEPVVAPAQSSKLSSVVATPSGVVGRYNFGDYRSSVLTSKAWQALAAQDMEGAIVYSNKCIELYAGEAARMQAALRDYPTGDPQQIFSYWALNDVSTCLFIQGEAYRKTKRFAEAKVAYERIVKEFSYGQAFDTGSRAFWKLADGAKDALYMIEKNLDLNYGNMSSLFLVLRMWESLNKKNLEEVIAYHAKLELLYSQVAKDMQRSLKGYPPLPAEKIHMFWALNDVGTGEFILGEAYREAGLKNEAIKAYKKVGDEYFYAQCWDPQGWFWKPADAAQQKIIEIEETGR